MFNHEKYSTVLNYIILTLIKTYVKRSRSQKIRSAIISKGTSLIRNRIVFRLQFQLEWVSENWWINR